MLKGCALSGDNSVNFFYHSAEKRSTLKGKNLFPEVGGWVGGGGVGGGVGGERGGLGESKFFPFGVDIFSERDCCSNTQTENHKSCLHFNNGGNFKKHTH